MSEESTTPDLVEHVVELFACGNQRAYGRLEDLFTEDAVLDLSRQGLGIYKGAEAIRSFCEGWIEVYEDFVLTAEELLDCSEGVVLTVNRHSGRLPDSSAPVILDNAWVFVCQENGIARWSAYDDTDEARAAAEGLAREGG